VTRVEFNGVAHGPHSRSSPGWRSRPFTIGDEGTERVAYLEAAETARTPPCGRGIRVTTASDEKQRLSAGWRRYAFSRKAEAASG
jgi:hypothetical protein